MTVASFSAAFAMRFFSVVKSLPLESNQLDPLATQLPAATPGVSKVVHWEIWESKLVGLITLVASLKWSDIPLFTVLGLILLKWCRLGSRHHNYHGYFWQEFFPSNEWGYMNHGKHMCWFKSPSSFKMSQLFWSSQKCLKTSHYMDVWGGSMCLTRNVLNMIPIWSGGTHSVSQPKTLRTPPSLASEPR